MVIRDWKLVLRDSSGDVFGHRCVDQFLVSEILFRELPFVNELTSPCPFSLITRRCAQNQGIQIIGKIPEQELEELAATPKRRSQRVDCDNAARYKQRVRQGKAGQGADGNDNQQEIRGPETAGYSQRSGLKGNRD